MLNLIKQRNYTFLKDRKINCFSKTMSPITEITTEQSFVNLNSECFKEIDC
jgi:hypothetical protein